MKKATGYQCKQDIINEQAKVIESLQQKITDAEEVIVSAVNLINVQQQKLAMLEAKLNAKESTRVTANKASDNNDRIIGLNRYGYSVKDAIASIIAYEESAKQRKMEQWKAETIAKMNANCR